MIDKVYDHILFELKENGKSNNIYFLIATLFNVSILIINSTFQTNQRLLSVFIIFIVLLIITNLCSIIIISKIKDTRKKLLKGLQKLYKDQNVYGYFDESILSNENTKMNMMMLIIISTGLTSIIVPIVLSIISIKY